MNTIPSHVRENYETTSEHLHQLRAMMLALDHMAEATRPPASPESESLFVLITAVQRKLIEADKAHTAEWVGMGGSTTQMTTDEIATARGEAEA